MCTKENNNRRRATQQLNTLPTSKCELKKESFWGAIPSKVPILTTTTLITMILIHISNSQKVKDDIRLHSV